jgi:hypothetical protein
MAEPPILLRHGAILLRRTKIDAFGVKFEGRVAGNLLVLYSNFHLIRWHRTCLSMHPVIASDDTSAASGWRITVEDCE